MHNLRPTSSNSTYLWPAQPSMVALAGLLLCLCPAHSLYQEAFANSSGICLI